MSDLNGTDRQTSSLLTFLTYTMIHEAEGFKRVTAELIRSGIIPLPDDFDNSLEEGDTDGQDATTERKPVAILRASTS